MGAAAALALRGAVYAALLVGTTSEVVSVQLKRVALFCILVTPVKWLMVKVAKQDERVWKNGSPLPVRKSSVSYPLYFKAYFKSMRNTLYALEIPPAWNPTPNASDSVVLLSLTIAANVVVQLSVPRVQNSPHVLVVRSRGGFLLNWHPRGTPG